MKVSVQFPIKLPTENELRSFPMVVAHVAAKRGAGAARGVAISIEQRVRKQRAEVRRYLDSQLPRPKRELLVGISQTPPHAVTRENFYRVTLIRISAGTLDTDGLEGTLKLVRDEIAAWLGIDDSARSPASWRYAQQKGPTKTYAVRIEIEDDDPDPREVHRIVGPTIERLGPVVGLPGEEPTWNWETFEKVAYRRAKPGARSVAGVARGLGMTTAQLRAMAPLKCQEIERRGQAPLVFRKAYFVLAEDGDDITLEELTGPTFEALLPPPRIRKSGRVLVRRLDDHPALGEHWIYEAAPSVAPPPRRAEARR